MLWPILGSVFQASPPHTEFLRNFNIQRASERSQLQLKRGKRRHDLSSSIRRKHSPAQKILDAVKHFYKHLYTIVQTVNMLFVQKNTSRNVESVPQMFYLVSTQYLSVILPILCIQFSKNLKKYSVAPEFQLLYELFISQLIYKPMPNEYQ